jgi:AcrR family transcriptional regulator
VSAAKRRDEPSFIEQARRAQMVRCGAEEIAENGYAAASLVAIARRAGVSRGVISYHFADKDDLIDQIITAYFADAFAFVMPRIAAKEGVRAQISAFIEANLEYLAAHPIEVRAAGEIAAHHRTRTGARLEEVRSEFKAGLAGLVTLLKQGQESGELRAFDPDAMAAILHHAVDGATAELVHNPDFDTTAYARELIIAFDLAIRA